MRIQRLLTRVARAQWARSCERATQPRANANVTTTAYRHLNTSTWLSNVLRNEPNNSSNVSATTVERHHEMSRVLQQADQIVGSTESSHNLQYLLSEEVSVVTQILRKLDGTNHSLSAIEKLYQSGSNPDQLIRGLAVLLLSKAGTIRPDKPEQENVPILQSQFVVAKVVEMIHMAMSIHKQICNVESHSAAVAHNGSSLHTNNKISVLYGDFLWAKAWKDLADLHNMEVADMMVSVLVNITQGQFVSEEECNDVANKLSLEYWLEKNFLLSACLPAFGCKSVLKLAEVDESLQNYGYYFGQNYGFYIKACQEIRWFRNAVPDPNEVLDFCSLPVVMHAMETGEKFQEIQVNSVPQHPQQARYDYEQLHKAVRAGPGIGKCKTVVEMFRANAFTNLNHLPHSEARDCLKRILDTMN